ncbi:MAG: hypothetical protein AAGE98_10705 [Actinomycetota bacterium]
MPMVDLSRLDDIDVPDRWSEITAGSAPTAPPQVGAPPHRVAALVAAAALAAAVAWLAWEPDSGTTVTDEPAVTLAPTTSVPPPPTSVVSVELATELAELGPDLSIEFRDRQPAETTWNRQIDLDGPRADQLRTYPVRFGEVSDAIVTRFELLGESDGTLWAIREWTAPTGLSSASDAIVDGPIDVVELLSVVGDGPPESSWIQRIDDAPVASVQWGDDGGLVTVHSLPAGTVAVTVEGSNGVHTWMRPSGGTVALSIPGPEPGVLVVRAIDSGAERLFRHLHIRRNLDEAAPSQSPVDADRDGVVAELAALPFERRVFPRYMHETDDTVWILSRPGFDDLDTQGCGFGNTIDGTYGLDVICTVEYGELLAVDRSTGRIRRAYPFSGVPPQWFELTDEALYCGRQGDGGLPDSMLCRIDLETGERLVRVFRPVDDAMDPDEYVPPGWVIEQRSIGLGAVEFIDDRGDFGIELSGPPRLEVDPLTLEVVAAS